MKSTLVLSMFLMGIGTAQANGLGQAGAELGPMHGGKGKKVRRLKRRIKRVCSRIQATDEQKAAIKEAAQATMAEVKPLRKAQKAKRKALRALIMDKGATKADVDAATAEVIQGRAAIATLRRGLQSTVVIDILNFEQRRPALRCMKLKKKLRRIMKRKGKGKRPGQGRIAADLVL